MGFLDKLKAKAAKKIRAGAAKKSAKILKGRKKTGAESAGKIVDKAFKKGNTVGKTGSVLRKKKN